MNGLQITLPLEKSYPESYIELEISITLDYNETLVKLRESEVVNHIEGGNSDDESASTTTETDQQQQQRSS